MMAGINWMRPLKSIKEIREFKFDDLVKVRKAIFYESVLYLVFSCLTGWYVTIRFKQHTKD